jgi:hypothetical protein
VVSLNDINAEVAEQYAPVPFEDVPGGTVHLLPLLSLDPARSDKALKLIKSLRTAQRADDVDAIVDLAKKLIEAVGEGDGGKRLVGEIKSVAALMKVIEHWMAATQPGEASNSGNS